MIISIHPQRCFFLKKKQTRGLISLLIILMVLKNMIYSISSSYLSIQSMHMQAFKTLILFYFSFFFFLLLLLFFFFYPFFYFFSPLLIFMLTDLLPNHKPSCSCCPQYIRLSTHVLISDHHFFFFFHFVYLVLYMDLTSFSQLVDNFIPFFFFSSRPQ